MSYADALKPITEQIKKQWGKIDRLQVAGDGLAPAVLEHILYLQRASDNAILKSTSDEIDIHIANLEQLLAAWEQAKEIQ